MSEANKSVLVVDTPECCMKCRLYYYEEYISNHIETYCIAKEQTYRKIDDIRTKPDWCPLSPLPSYRPINTDIQRGDTKSMTHLITSIHDIGYNECLDDILKGKNNGQILL